MYNRLGLARRIVEIWPDECWQVQPEVYEEEEEHLTEFEKGRVTAEHKERYIVSGVNGEFEAEITGNMRLFLTISISSPMKRS